VTGLSQRIEPARSPRVARRRERMKAALLAAGVRQFSERGIEAVSVAELLAEADVSRATFYGLFSSKYNLLESILNPIFDMAARGFRAAADAQPAMAALAGLIDVYVDLWREHRDGLLLIPGVDLETFPHFRARHEALNEAMMAVLTRAENAGLLRNGSARYSLRVLAKTAIPLLRVYDGHPAGESLFRDALTSLLVRSA
jgi:AcrR family transcriptional regulator